MCMNHALSFCDSCSFTYSLKVSVPQGSLFGLPVFLLCLLWVTSLTWIHSVATCAVISLAHPSTELQTQVPNYWVCPLGHPTSNSKVTCLSCIPFQSGPPPVSLSWWLAPLPSGPPKSEVTRESSQSPPSHFQPSILSLSNCNPFSPFLHDCRCFILLRAGLLQESPN